MQKEKADAAVRQTDEQTDRWAVKQTDLEWSAANVSRISLLIEYAFISWGHRRRRCRPCRRRRRRTHKGSAQQRNCVKDLPACLAGAAASSHSVCVRKQQKDTTTHQHTDTPTHTHSAHRAHQHKDKSKALRKSVGKVSHTQRKSKLRAHRKGAACLRAPLCVSLCLCVCVSVCLSVICMPMCLCVVCYFLL